MPGGVGHTFVNKRFVLPAPPGTIIVGRGGVKRIYIHATLADNPHIDPGYRQSLEALPEAEKRAKLYGDWDSYSGQVFDEFRDRAYPDEPENALHVIDEFEIPAWWPRIVIGDWGFAAMTWIGWGAISPSKRLYIYREQWWVKTKISEWSPVVKELIEIDKPRLVKFCKSAGNEVGQEHTIQEQISEALGIQIELTTNSPGSRISGKQLIHEYMRWKPRPTVLKERPVYNEEHSMWLLRNRSMDEYKSYMNSLVEPEPETNIPKLQIFSSCKMLIDAIKACSYDKKKIEDIAAFSGDDPIDGLRYLVDGAENYFEIAGDEFKRIQKQEDLIHKLSADGDWTGFYRQMRTAESGDPYKPIRKFHHARH
jgi:hypothetical protein